MIASLHRGFAKKVAFGLLALVMIAFIVTGFGSGGGGLGDLAPGAPGDAVATVDGQKLTAADLTRRAQNALNAAKQDNPALDMPMFVRGGGLDQVINQYINARAMQRWAEQHGIAASDRLIDGEIASIPAFRGPAGKFDQQAMNAVLSQQRISERDLRADIAGEALRRQLLVPVAGGAKAPQGMVMPYASLLLEERVGSIGMVPSDAIPAGPPPADTAIDAYYKANIARFTIPERRVMRYAIFGMDSLKEAVPAPTEAEIAAFYKANAASYGASETRTLDQAIVPDQAAANALAAKVRAGTPFAAAAAMAGVAATTATVDRKQLTERAAADVAAAAFAAPAKAVTAPVKAPLGWYVFRVDAVNATAGRSLEAAHAEIAASLAKQKNDEALANMVAAVEEAISDGSTFDEVVRSEKLTAVTTPALLPNGTSPDDPAYKAPPELGVLLRAAFQASPDDDPTVEVIGAGQRYALVGVSKIVPPTPAPLPRVRDAVVAEMRARAGAARAKAIADAIVARVKAGTPMAQAFAGAGVPLPGIKPAAARQMDIARTDKPAPPPLTLLFSMRKGDTKTLAAPQNAGWYVVHLDKVTPGDAATQPGLVQATRGNFDRVLGDEYAEQFAKATARELGVKRNAAAIGRLRAELTGAQAQ